MDREDLERQYDERSRAEYDRQLEEILGGVERVLRSLPVRFQIKGRVKSFAEYYRKWTSLGAPIEDMLGVRIVCPFLEDVEAVERALLDNLSIADVDRKAEQRSFHEFGYDSTHLVLDLGRETVPHPLPGVARVCEIQIRTILQDAWAEVEHQLIYKSDWSIPTDRIRRKLAALNANLTLSDLIFQELRELQKEVQRMQARRRDVQAVRGRIAPEVESRALQAQLRAGGDDAHDLDLDKLLLRALTAHSDGELARAARLYSKVLTRPVADKVRSMILNHRGMAYFALGETNAARTDFESAATLDRTSHRAWHNLAVACRSLGDLERAIEAFGLAAELDPTAREARIGRIRCLVDAGDAAGARTALDALGGASAQSDDLEELHAAVAALESRRERPGR